MRLCKTCCMEHDSSTMCPPHEVRPSGMLCVHLFREDAEREVERLEAALARYRWIPVGERQPKDIPGKGYSEHVMVSDGKVIFEGWYVTTGGYNNPSGLPYWASSFTGKHGTITHWRPIDLPGDEPGIV